MTRQQPFSTVVSGGVHAPPLPHALPDVGDEGVEDTVGVEGGGGRAGQVWGGQQVGHYCLGHLGAASPSQPKLRFPCSFFGQLKMSFK